MSDSTKKAKGTGPPHKAKSIAKTQLVDGLARLFDSGDYSDLTVKCGEHVWKVHRSILCPRSTFFKNACKDWFREGISHVIELKEDDPTLLREVLFACYTCGYDDTIGGGDNSNKLDFNARIYATADKYDMPFLKKLATAAFQAQLDDDDDHRGPMDTPRFLKAVGTIYTTTPGSDRGLRDLVLPVVKRHRNELVKNDGFLDLIRSGLADGDFAQDVIAALSQLQDPKPELVYFCPDCNGHALSASLLIRCHRSACGKYMSAAKKE